MLVHKRERKPQAIRVLSHCSLSLFFRPRKTRIFAIHPCGEREPLCPNSWRTRGTRGVVLSFSLSLFLFLFLIFAPSYVMFITSLWKKASENCVCREHTCILMCTVASMRDWLSFTQQFNNQWRNFFFTSVKGLLCAKVCFYIFAEKPLIVNFFSRNHSFLFNCNVSLNENSFFSIKERAKLKKFNLTIKF